MSLTAVGLIVLLLGVLLIGTPVAFGLGFVSVVAILLFMSPGQLSQIGNIIFNQGVSVNQLIAPLFILMAEILSKGHIAKDIFYVLSKWLGRINGGLGIAATLASTIFASLSGSSPATAAAIGRISIKEMIDRKYNAELATGVVAAGGTIGIMIPPSLSMVVYGIITETSVAKLFVAGLLPGILISALICFYVFIRGTINPELVGKQRESKEQSGSEISQNSKSTEAMENDGGFLRDAKFIVPPLILIGFLLVSLYTGIATPTEVAGLGVIGSIVLVILLGRFKISLMRDALSEAARFSVMIVFLIFGGMALSYVVSYLGIAQMLVDWVIYMGINKWVLLIFVYLLWLILGCLLDPLSMIVLTVPFFFPILTAMGFDPIWIGVVATLAVEIGMITPPVGLNLFVLKAITDVPMIKIIRGTIPFVLVLLIAMLILTLFPQIALYLPSKM